MDDIRLLCLDVDGVLTDGRLYIGEDGTARRAFDIQDGLAIRWLIRLGYEVAIITGKRSETVAARARELDIRHVVQASENKLADLRKVLAALDLRLDQTAAIGDDLPDLAVLRRCGLPIAVQNAVPEVKAAARYVTHRRGGDGAVREAIELILTRAGRWSEVVAHYEGQA